MSTEHHHDASDDEAYQSSHEQLALHESGSSASTDNAYEPQVHDEDEDDEADLDFEADDDDLDEEDEFEGDDDDARDADEDEFHGIINPFS